MGAALATVAVIGLVSMSGISSPTRRRMPPSDEVEGAEPVKSATEDVAKPEEESVSDDIDVSGFTLPARYLDTKPEKKPAANNDVKCDGCGTKDGTSADNKYLMPNDQIRWKLFEVKGCLHHDGAVLHKESTCLEIYSEKPSGQNP